MAKNGKKASRAFPFPDYFSPFSPQLVTAESGPRLLVLAFRSMRVAEASLRSRRRYVLAGKKENSTTRGLLISSVAQLTSSFALRASS